MVNAKVLDEVRKNAGHNFQAMMEITELSLAMKQAWLQRQHPEMSGEEVTALMYRELRAAKDEAWKKR